MGARKSHVSVVLSDEHLPVHGGGFVRWSSDDQWFLLRCIDQIVAIVLDEMRPIEDKKKLSSLRKSKKVFSFLGIFGGMRSAPVS